MHIPLKKIFFLKKRSNFTCKGYNIFSVCADPPHPPQKKLNLPNFLGKCCTQSHHSVDLLSSFSSLSLKDPEWTIPKLRGRSASDNVLPSGDAPYSSADVSCVGILLDRVILGGPPSRLGAGKVQVGGWSHPNVTMAVHDRMHAQWVFMLRGIHGITWYCGFIVDCGVRLDGIILRTVSNILYIM